jgi:hypothetical protein
MQKARDRVLKTRWVGVDELVVAPYYADLYPLPRDLSGLRRSFDRHGYRAEYPVVVRACGGAFARFEIVCGVGRHAVASERGMRRIPVVVRRFDGDDEALAYAAEDALFGAGAARPGLAHMIVLARALRGLGRECAPREVSEAAGVSASTYWRAARCVEHALREAAEEVPALGDHDPIRLAAEIVRRGLDPTFSLLLAGKIEVNTFAAQSTPAHKRGGRQGAGKEESAGRTWGRQLSQKQPRKE